MKNEFWIRGATYVGLTVCSPVPINGADSENYGESVHSSET